MFPSGLCFSKFLQNEPNFSYLRPHTNAKILLRMRHLLLTLALGSVLAAAPATDTWRDVSPHRSGVIQANGIRLHYLDWGGTGDAMVFLAGLGNTAHVFDTLAPKFTGRFRAIGMTRRGFGQSERPDTGYDIPSRVSDLVGFLDALKIQKAILVGHSLAGDELTAFAMAHPQRVIKLVYLDAAYDRSKMPAASFEKMQQVVMASMFAKLPKLPPETTPLERDIAMGKSRFGSLWNEALEAEARENYERAADGGLKRRLVAPMHLLIGGSQKAKLDNETLASPALSFFAQSDPLEDVPEEKRKEAAEAARAVAAYLDGEIASQKKNPRARVVVLEKANHYCWFDRGDLVVREMNAFLEGTAEIAVRRTIQNIIAADNARDLEGVVALYTPDAVLLPPGLAPIAGTAAIRERYRGLYANSLPRLNQSIEELVVREDWAFVRGRTLGLFPGGPNQPAREIHDKFVMLLSRDGTAWRVARLMWNTSKAGN